MLLLKFFKKQKFEFQMLKFIITIWTKIRISDSCLLFREVIFKEYLFKIPLMAN